MKSHRYEILTVNRRKRLVFGSILTLKHDQKYSHSGRELDVLEFDLRKSDDVSRGRTAGSVESRYASWRATRIVARSLPKLFSCLASCVFADEQISCIWMAVTSRLSAVDL